MQLLGPRYLGTLGDESGDGQSWVTGYWVVGRYRVFGGEVMKVLGRRYLRTDNPGMQGAASWA